jgi:hypothetical protein
MISRLEGLNNTSRIVPVARVDAVAGCLLDMGGRAPHHDKAQRRPSFRLVLLLVPSLQSASLSLPRPTGSIAFLFRRTYSSTRLAVCILFNNITTAWTALVSSTAIMQTKSIILVAFATLGQARFGQEGAIQNIIQGLSNFGEPGAAGALAGQTPGVLLGGANACAKVRHPNAGPRVWCNG